MLAAALVAAGLALAVPGTASAQGQCFGGSGPQGDTVPVGLGLEYFATGGGGDFTATVTVDWGDGTVETQTVSGGATATFANRYDAEGTFAFTFTAEGQLGTDDEGNPVPCSQSDSGSFVAVVVACFQLGAPIVLSGDSTGWTFEIGPFDERPGEAVRLRLNWGDGTPTVDAGTSASAPTVFTHDYPAEPPRTYEVTLSADGFLEQNDPNHIPCRNDPEVVARYTVTGPGEPGPDPDPPLDEETPRLFGSERIGTSVEISQAQWPDGADTAVLARADIAPDALAGATLAEALGGPLLLTTSDRLHDLALAELQRILEPGARIYVLGGVAAIQDSVLDGLRAAGFDPVRVFGSSRTETAVAIANATTPTPTAVFIADAFAFADALIAGATAAGTGGVVVTTGPTLPAETAAYLDAHDDVPHYAVGAVAAEADPSATPFVGDDVYETATLLADEFYDDPDEASVASGENFPDGLAGGAFAGTRRIPLLLTPQAGLDDDVAAWFEREAPLQTIYVFGGPAALSETVYEQLQDYVG